MLADLIDASNWTPEQWLTISILVFIVLAVLVMMHRMYRIFQMSRRQSYKPNLRPLRRTRSWQSNAARKEEHKEDHKEEQKDERGNV